jgi:hypothetical protein
MTPRMVVRHDLAGRTMTGPEYVKAVNDARVMANLATRANDVQSVVAVSGRLPRDANDQRIRLPGTDLRRARMWQLNLDAALLGGSSLRLAGVWGSSLIGADLGDCDLRDADVTGADLTRAVLWGADLRGADLTDAVDDAETRWPEDFQPGSHALVKVIERHEATRHRFRQTGLD